MSRVYNFSAGPSVLPESVLQKAAAEMSDYRGTGQSVMEMSHRSKAYKPIVENTEALLRELMGVPDNYKVLFLQGGASLQFAMVPLNLRKKGRAAYVDTGVWASKAEKEAKKWLETVTVASSKAEEALDTLARTTLTTSGAERVAALEALAESSPAEFRFSVLSALARSAAEAGDLDRAAAAYGKAAQLEKGQPMGLAAELAQVGVLLRAGKGEDALKLLQALESGMAEESRLEMLPLVADAAEMAGKKDVAADAYDRLGKAYPGEDGSFYRARAAELGKK